MNDHPWCRRVEFDLTSRARPEGHGKALVSLMSRAAEKAWLGLGLGVGTNPRVQQTSGESERKDRVWEGHAI